MADAPPPASATRTWTLALGALGVVFGDIGTSPLYAIKECFHGLHAIPIDEVNVLGTLSLVFWSLTVVISVKYLGFIMRADNRGEGGIFALLALVPGHAHPSGAGRGRSAVLFAALFGAALLYGDGIITPAISVLSAVEGVSVATAAAEPLVVPLTVAILVALFAFQRHGTGRLGNVFGPVMLLWFVVLAILGLRGILRHPSVLAAVDPRFAVTFFATNHLHGLVVLGSVVLVITGGEALYADMGHFGRAPIRRAWYGLAFPALLLNYFGQGAALLADPGIAENPFYGLVPRALLVPMVALATAAAVIASQALISGAFSLTQQAVQLGYLPRAHIVHTSGMQKGQIYIPEVNTALAVACVGLVLAFQHSSRLAAAYGIAVTANMAITSLVYYFVVRKTWGWSYWHALPLVAVFLAFDVAYFGANLLKFLDGGWFPIAVAALVFTVMTTWKRGRAELSRRVADALLPFDLFLADVERRKPLRVPGTAVFMSGAPRGTPSALLHHLKHNHVIHQQVVLLSIAAQDRPTVPDDERLELQDRGNGFYRLVARYGFMEAPDVPAILERARALGLQTEPLATSFFLGRETLLTSGRSGMARWRKRLFAVMSQNARSPTAYFHLPPGRVIELGMQVEI